MRHTYKFSLLLLSATLFLGCSEKSFTLQSYADEYFNNKPAKEETEAVKTQATAEKSENEVAEQAAPVNKTSSSHIDDKTNAAIKSGPGADVAWSSTYKKDKASQGQGALQKSLDEWTKEEWEPAFEGDEQQAKADENASKTFTLQHYVDKATKYMKRKEEAKAGQPYKPANYEKMEAMPVIGN